MPVQSKFKFDTGSKEHTVHVLNVRSSMSATQAWRSAPWTPLHLASAERSQSWPLCSNDARMRAAATQLGLPLAPLPQA